MQVTNVADTGDRRCACGSWLNHWMRMAIRPLPLRCLARGCFEAPTVGAHVRRPAVLAALVGPAVIIVPLCDGHNKVREPFEVDNDAPLVSANPAETCGRPAMRR